MSFTIKARTPRVRFNPDTQGDEPEECRFCGEEVPDDQRFTDTRGRLFCSQVCMNWGSR